MDTMLFTPLRIRGVDLKNRILLSPMLTCSAEDGHVGDWHFMHLGKYAAGGCGLVFMESAKVDPRGCIIPTALRFDRLYAYITPWMCQQKRSKRRAVGITPAGSAV